MKKTGKKILVTGGLGFIGSYFIDLLLDRGFSVTNIDKVTYAARKDLKFNSHPNYRFIKEDIACLKEIPNDLDYLVNFAAESHVDNSILSNQPFFHSNVNGVYNLLELIHRLSVGNRPLFVQISTDEVYGDILEGSFTELDRLNPSSPYSASKAAADMLVHAWSRTYGLKTIIVRSCNNYGYGQYSEKLIPRAMKNAQKLMKIPVHGDGSYKREWIYAGDNCEAIFLAMTKGENGEIYNISTNEEFSNLEVIRMILRMMGKTEELLELVADRPGQDLRYSVSADKIRKLGWRPQMTLERYLPKCEELNKERRKNLPPGRKQFLLGLLGFKKKK
jgi:dTDP-glucose 4,6-dehydratase